MSTSFTAVVTFLPLVSSVSSVFTCVSSSGSVCEMSSAKEKCPQLECHFNNTDVLTVQLLIFLERVMCVMGRFSVQ